MFLPMKNLTAALFLLTTSCSLAEASQPQQRKPLTDFQPSKDFFQVPNNPPDLLRGNCLGIVEAAITHWNDMVDRKGFDENKRLAKLHERLKNSPINSPKNPPRGEFEARDFLQKINSYAHNHSVKNAVTAPHTGNRLADLLFADLNRTKKPQVLGIEMPDKSGKVKPAHALEVYDAEKTADGNIIFSVGDPNFPGKNDLKLIYHSATGDWADKNFPYDTPGPDGKKRPMIRGFRPSFVHWDKGKTAEIPNQDKFKLLMRRVMNAIDNPYLTPEAIGAELNLLKEVPWNCPETVADLDRPQDIPRTQTHPIVGSWTITSGFSSGQTLTFERGGRFASAFPAPGTWQATGANSAKATLTYDTPGLAFTCTYDITITNGQADVTYTCTATRGRVDPPSGSFKISKR